MATGTDYDLVKIWDAATNYLELDWQVVRAGIGHELDQRFIRITGEATAEQAADVVNTVAKFRQVSDAFVVANSVKVAGQAVFDELAIESSESIKAFDVLNAIYSKLEPREIEVVRNLLQ
jgi:hypothetical protein